MNELEIKARAIVIQFQFQVPLHFDVAKQLALISIGEKIDLLKEIQNEGINVYQSLSTPKKLFVDILNPKLKELETIKEIIQKL